MINTVIVDKAIEDIYSTVVSNEYIKYVFANPIVVNQHHGDDMKILAKYNKEQVLSKYKNNDFINLVNTLFSIDNLILSIKQDISYIQDGFKVSQVLYVDTKDNDIIFAAILSNFKILLEIDITNSDVENMTHISLNKTQIIENNDFSAKSSSSTPQLSQYNKPMLKKINIDKFLENYERNKDDFFCYDTSNEPSSQNIITNILNVITKNAITYEYIRNICEYFAMKKIDTYSIVLE